MFSRASSKRPAPDSAAPYSPAPTYPAPERPAPPKPERLNRNVLTIAAVLMGTLVLTAVIFMQPAKPPAETAPSAPVVTVPRSTFLDEPLASSNAATVRGPGSTAAGSGDVALNDSAMLAGRVDTPRGMRGVDPYGRAVSGGGATGNPPSYAPSVGVAGEAPRNPRASAYAAALAAPVVVSAGRRSDGSASVGSETTWTTDAGTVEGEAGQRGAVGITSTNGFAESSSAGAAGTSPAAGQTPQERWMAAAARPTATALRTSVEPVPGPYTVQAGSVIPGILITEVNSDLPGDIVAQVARDVFDSQTQRTLLLPKGARLLGKYDNQVGVGQDRLLVAWTRVIFPDGRSIALPGLPAKDRAGAAGLHDQVDQHGRRVFGTAALLSLITAGAQLAQPNGGYGPLGYPSPGQIAAGAAGQQLSEVAAQLLRRGMDVQPTIRVRAGMPFNVFLNADLTFPGPYARER